MLKRVGRGRGQSSTRIGGEGFAEEPPWQAGPIIHVKDLCHAKGVYTGTAVASRIGLRGPSLSARLPRVAGEAEAHHVAFAANDVEWFGPHIGGPDLLGRILGAQVGLINMQPNIREAGEGVIEH